MVGVAEVKMRVKEVTDGIPEVKNYLACAISGALAALCGITPEISPFGVAMVAAAPGRFALPTAVGAGLGYVLSPFGSFNVQYLAAILLVLCFRWAIAIADPKIIRLLNPVIGGGAVAASTIVIAISDGLSLYTAAIIAAQSVTTIAAGYIFSIAIYHLKNSAAGQIGMIAVLTSGVILGSGLCRISIGHLSVGRVIMVVVLSGIVANYGILLAGGAAGLSLIVLLSSGSAFMGVPIVIATVIACGFRGLGKIATGVSFFLSAVAIGYFLSGATVVIPIAIETALGSLIMLVMPRRFFGELEHLVAKGQTDPNVLSIAITKLSETATALREVADLTQQVNTYIGKSKGDDGESLYGKTAELVCQGCPKTPECWQCSFNDTMDGMSKIISGVKSGRCITVAELPQPFSGRCVKLNQMVDTLTSLTLGYMGRYGMKQQLSCMRSVVTDQFDGVALLLDSTAREIGEIRSVAPELSAQLKEMLGNIGVMPLWTGCYEDLSGLKTVMVKIPILKLNSALDMDLPHHLSNLLGEPLVQGSIVEQGETATITYHPKPLFKLEVEGSQRAADGGRWCGDSYTNSSTEGSAMVALSDGMGVGGEAAVDSVMTITLLSRLYNAGVRPEAALKLINGALLAKEGEERLATVDCCTVNLYNGKTEFYKAGAAPSFVIRGGRVINVTGSALPAGILGDVSFARSSLQLEEGDIIVMVSDGITDSGDSWITSELRAMQELPLKEMSYQLLQTAINRNTTLREDDMSVVAIKVAVA